MENKIVAPILYVCTGTNCDFSGGTVGVDKDGKPRLMTVKTRKGNEKLALASPPYGVVSAKVGDKVVCPACGQTCTEIEGGRHKFLRLNSQRISVLREKMRLIGNTMKGAQYNPQEDDLVKVQKILYAEMDVLSDLIDKRLERVKNPNTDHRAGRKAGVVKIKIPFAL